MTATASPASTVVILSVPQSRLVAPSPRVPGSPVQSAGGGRTFLGFDGAQAAKTFVRAVNDGVGTAGSPLRAAQSSPESDAQSTSHRLVARGSAQSTSTSRLLRPAQFNGDGSPRSSRHRTARPSAGSASASHISILESELDSREQADSVRNGQVSVDRASGGPNKPPNPPLPLQPRPPPGARRPASKKPPSSRLSIPPSIARAPSETVGPGPESQTELESRAGEQTATNAAQHPGADPIADSAGKTTSCCVVS